MKLGAGLQSGCPHSGSEHDQVLSLKRLLANAVRIRRLASVGDAQRLQEVKGGPQGPACFNIVDFLC